MTTATTRSRSTPAKSRCQRSDSRDKGAGTSVASPCCLVIVADSEFDLSAQLGQWEPSLLLDEDSQCLVNQGTSRLDAGQTGRLGNQCIIKNKGGASLARRALHAKEHIPRQANRPCHRGSAATAKKIGVDQVPAGALGRMTIDLAPSPARADPTPA